MKTFKYFIGALLISAMTFTACDKKVVDDPIDEDDPIEEGMPTVAAVTGKVVIVLNCINNAVVCNPLVFAGNYNGYGTNAAEMARFEAIEGYENWYKVVITPDPAAATETSILEGKPNQLAKDGSFPSSWDYQWLAELDVDGTTVLNPCEVIKGSATLKVEYTVESSLIVAPGADVVYIRAYSWKKNPCVEAEKYEVTFTVTTPAMHDSCTVYVVGSINGWDASANPMTKVDATHWTTKVSDVEFGAEYKYVVNSNWEYEELQAKAAGADCATGISNRKVNDREMNDNAPNFKIITADKCPDAE
jgi:hypothetical protein